MIKINLAPYEEIENKHWYLPDLTITISTLLLLQIVNTVYFMSMDSKINSLETDRLVIVEATNKLKPDLVNYEGLDNKIKKLSAKIEALKKITISKIEKYKPIITLEHLQTLKPDGVWFTSLAIESKEELIKIAGGALDNLLVADFISAIDSTRTQEFDPSDMRSQVYFVNLNIGKVTIPKLTTNSSSSSASLGNTKDIPATDITKTPDLPAWEITIKIATRTAAKPQIGRAHV